MDPRLPKRGRLLEFFFMIAVVGGVALVLLDRLQTLEAIAERTLVETTIRNINSGLRLQRALRVTQGREGEWPRERQTNPVRWLERPPVGYRGELADERDLGHGQWAWLPRSRQLAYRPAHNRGLIIAEGRDILGFKLIAGNGSAAYWGPAHAYDWQP